MHQLGMCPAPVKDYDDRWHYWQMSRQNKPATITQLEVAMHLRIMKSS